MSMSKTAIALSGGVDSSAAAVLLHEAGEELIGVTMRLFSPEDTAGIDPTCCTTRDIDDARNVADTLGIPYHVIPFADRFEEHVIDRFVEAYQSGRTPNPCIDCNAHLKFDALFEAAEKMGCERIATGHYARVEYDENRGRYLLKKGLDGSKDQGYVLYRLTQEQLSRVIFPLGGYTKPEIRAIAERRGLINADKKESQDICFIPDGDYASFIERHLGKTFPAGDFVDTEGHILGQHKGIIRYTLGQRKGLGISSDAPLYVVKIEPSSNTVVLGREEDLYSRTLTAHDINLIAYERIDVPLRVTAKARYRQKEMPATVVQTDDDTLRLEFDEPLRAITPGQSVVLYEGDIVVGGGIIDEV